MNLHFKRKWWYCLGISCLFILPPPKVYLVTFDGQVEMEFVIRLVAGASWNPLYLVLCLVGLNDRHLSPPSAASSKLSFRKPFCYNIFRHTMIKVQIKARVKPWLGEREKVKRDQKVWWKKTWNTLMLTPCSDFFFSVVISVDFVVVVPERKKKSNSGFLKAMANSLNKGLPFVTGWSLSGSALSFSRKACKGSTWEEELQGMLHFKSWAGSVMNSHRQFRKQGHLA